MAEPAPLAADAGAVYAAAGDVDVPLPSDDAAADEIPAPEDLEPQQAKERAPRVASQPLLIIPLCRRGDRVGIERQVQAGASVEETDIEGNTPLHVAVEAPRNEIATVQCLLELGANINAVNILGAAPLHYVCLRRSNHRGIANILLENGAAIDSQTHAGKSPLHFACEQQNPDLVEVLCLFGANPNLCDIEGNTPMHLAMVKLGGRDTVKRQIVDVLIAHGAVPHPANAQGVTPMHLACKGGYLRSLAGLMEVQQEVCEAQTGRGETGLHLACAGNQSEVTQILLSAVPDTMNVQDLDGNTPLHMCASVDNLESAVLLLRAGADTSVRNNQKKTAFELSKMKGTDLTSTHNPELVQILKDAQKGANCRQS